jgi:hypothetical protein
VYRTAKHPNALEANGAPVVPWQPPNSLPPPSPSRETHCAGCWAARQTCLLGTFAAVKANEVVSVRMVIEQDRLNPRHYSLTLQT